MARYNWEVLKARPNPAGNVRVLTHRNYTRHSDAVRAMKGLQRKGWSAIIKPYFSDLPRRSDASGYDVSVYQTRAHSPLFVENRTWFELCAEVYDFFDVLRDEWGRAYAVSENGSHKETFYAHAG